MKGLVVVGASGFGRETLDVVDAVNTAGERPLWNLVGVVDDAPSAPNLDRLAARRIPFLGTLEEWLSSGGNAHVVIAVGHPPTRERLAARVPTHQAATVVHPSATLGHGVVLGPGTVVCAGVQISTNVRTGQHVHLNPNATVGHDTALDDFVSVNPGATVSGECRIEAGVMVGAGAVVLQQLTVGAGAVVGAAACVTRSVRAGVVAVGVPARWPEPAVAP